MNIIRVLGFCIVVCLCSSCICKKNITKTGEEIEGAGAKYKTIDEHLEKYLVEERKEDQKRMGCESRTVSQRQKELRDDFEKEINEEKVLFKKGIEKK